MVAPKHKNSCLGRHEFYNFGRLVLGHYMYYYSLSLSDVCLEVAMKFTISFFPYPQNATYQIW